MSERDQVPIFLYSWMTSLTHSAESMNDLQRVDEYLVNLIQRLDLTNSILIVMGDHGYRFGQFRETQIGWYEDKLPWLSIYLPGRVKEKHPGRAKALEANSK